MKTPVAAHHNEYVANRREQDAEFSRAYDEVRATMDLALALTDLRETRNLSQRALAEKSGIKQPMINRIERGSQVPRPFTLLRLLAALNGILTMRPDGSICVSPAEPISSPVQPEGEYDLAPGTAEQSEEYKSLRAVGSHNG